MKIHDLKPAPGSRRPKRRVARGIGGRLTEEFTRTLDRTRLSLTG